MENINIKYIKSGDYSLGFNNNLLTFISDKVILYSHDNNDISSLKVEKCLNLNNRDEFINLLSLMTKNNSEHK